MVFNVLCDPTKYTVTSSKRPEPLCEVQLMCNCDKWYKFTKKFKT